MCYFLRFLHIVTTNLVSLHLRKTNRWITVYIRILMSLKQRWQELMANQPLKRKLYEIIFGSDTPMGKSFDLLLMVCILLSIFLTIFDSLFTNPWLVGSLVFLARQTERGGKNILF